jgi:dihydrofolate reductase
MSNDVIVIEFVTLDGVVEDPDGTQGTPGGGWAFRHGPEAVAGDKSRLGPILDTGVLLFGRRTWQLFSRIWPGRTDDFATAMNAADKVVASRTLDSVTAWANSTLLEGDLVAGVERLRADRPVVVVGSTGLVHQLAAAGTVDEYRLLVFPIVLGAGERLFPPGAPAELRLESADVAGPAVLLRHRVVGRGREA